MDVSQRLIRLMRTIATDKFDSITRFIEEGSDLFDERLRSWEERFNVDEDDFTGTDDHSYQQYESKPASSGYPEQVVEDLQLFGLTPPSTLDEVRQVRNREIKKFHPDKYLNQPDKLETAKRILQIYNTAYDRLKNYYRGEI